MRSNRNRNPISPAVNFGLDLAVGNQREQAIAFDNVTEERGRNAAEKRAGPGQLACQREYEIFGRTGDHLRDAAERETRRDAGPEK